MDPKEVIEESWDKKKIVITAVLFLAVGFGGLEAKKYFLDQQKTISPTDPKISTTREVQGITTGNQESGESEDTTVPIQAFSPQTVQTEVQKKIETITQQVTQLSVTEIASSSPQIQKILQDMKALEQYPRNQTKEMCLNICNNL